MLVVTVLVNHTHPQLGNHGAFVWACSGCGDLFGGYVAVSRGRGFGGGVDGGWSKCARVGSLSGGQEGQGRGSRFIGGLAGYAVPAPGARWPLRNALWRRRGLRGFELRMFVVGGASDGAGSTPGYFVRGAAAARRATTVGAGRGLGAAWR